MAAEIPPSLKLITSAIRRAEELDKDSNPEAKIVAYYCRYYAVSKGSKLCSVPAVPAETKFLIDEMGKLEKFKASTPDLNQELGASVCKSYAMNVFQKADDEDRMGMADKGTAKLFYAAGTFFDIMEQFGELPSEVCIEQSALNDLQCYTYPFRQLLLTNAHQIVEKRKYAKWKATEILNAIKNGERPVPGGYGEVRVCSRCASHRGGALQ